MLLKISEAGWYLIGSSSLFILLFVLFVFFYSRVMDRQNTMLLKEQKIRSEYEEALLRTQLEIQEQTLKTISEEIHDNIGQVLSLAKLKLNTLDFARLEILREKTTEAKNLVSKAIQDLRDLSRSLNTDTIASLGLIRALEQELELFTKSGYQTSLVVEGAVRKMEPQKELIIFRIIQESLNNIIKHAEASSIRVTAVYEETGLQLQVEDDGKGTGEEKLDMADESYRSLGLRNMHNRATIIGARFAIQSVPGKGTRVNLEIPFN